MRIVIDTNVLISYVLWPKSNTSALVKSLFRDHTILRSLDCFSELSNVLMRKKFDPYLPMEDRQKFLIYYEDNAEYVVIDRRINACRDPQDNMFLELAMSGDADIILSGDQDLLVLNPFENIRIVNPSQFGT